VTTSVTLAATRPWPEQFTSVKGTGTLVNFKYTYADGTGNVTTFEDFVDSTNTMPALGYDAIDRLVQASSNAEARGFGYDGVGNITSQTFGSSAMAYTYDPGGTNRLISITGTGGARSYSFSYGDPYGNVTHNGTQSFSYDDAGNMTCARCGQVVHRVTSTTADMRVRAQKSGVNVFHVALMAICCSN
jgi:YD repeat-containing protein